MTMTYHEAGAVTPAGRLKERVTGNSVGVLPAEPAE
jgi:hypothetical protein